MKKMSFWLVLLLPMAISASYSCPREIESCNYSSDRTQSGNEVRESIVHVFSNIFGTNINSNTDRELYEIVSSELGINTTAQGFVQFQEAVNEIIAASVSECSKSASTRIGLQSVTVLAMNFSQLLDEGSLSEAREIYGKLLCLNSTLEDQSNVRRRRQNDNEKALEDFFNSLDGEQFGVIFGFVIIIEEEKFSKTAVRPTLAFVVDNTGSMGDEIESVRRLIKSFVRTERSIPLFYIYTTFNDPYVGVPMKYSSTNITELQELIIAVNETNPTGGDDCPELGMTGILNALSLSNPDSNVIVLTDAAPKDTNLTEEVIEKALMLRNAIHFFISDPFCGDVTDYILVANATNGIVVNTNTDFEAFAQFADSAAAFRFGSTAPSLTGRRKKQAEETCIQFVTNVFTVTINLLVKVSPDSILTITSPSGEVVSLNVSGVISSYSNTAPQPGLYEVCSNMGDFEYALTVPTALDFFVEYLENEAYSTQPPSEGAVTNVTIITSRLSDISMDMPISLSLIDANDDSVEITTVPLMQCSGFLTGSVIIPNITFQYRLRGTDIYGFAFEHTSNHLVESTASSERSITLLDCPTPSSPTLASPTVPPITPSGSSTTSINFTAISIINRIALVITLVMLGIM